MNDGFVRLAFVGWLGLTVAASWVPSAAFAQGEQEEPSPGSSESSEGPREAGGSEESEDAQSSEAGEPGESSETAGDAKDEGDESDASTESSESSESAAQQDAESPSEPRGTAYDLEELLRRAKTNEDLLAEFEAKRDQAEWKRYQAKWANAPKLQSLTTLAPVPADADPDQIQRNYDEIAAFNIGPFINEDLDLVVPVFTFGRIRTLRELADVGVDVADLKRREARLNAVYQTKRAYYSLQLSRSFGPILRKGNQRIDKQLQEMQDELDFGTADFETKDLRKLQIFAARVDSRISDNEKLESVSSSGLKALADLDDERLQVGELDTEGEPPPLADFQTYMGAASRNRPELEQLDKAVRARELQVRLEKREFLPNVFVAGKLGVGWSTKTVALKRVCRREGRQGECVDTDDLWARPESTPFNRFTVGVTLGMRWKLDPVVQHGKLQEKQAKLRTLEAQQNRARDAIRVELRKNYENATDQRKKVAIGRRRLEAARKWRNQLGLTMETAGKKLDEMDDAVKPLKEYYQAKAKYLEARYRYKVARAALAQAVGVEDLRPIEERAGVGTEQSGETSGEEREDEEQ